MLHEADDFTGPIVTIKRESLKLFLPRGRKAITILKPLKTIRIMDHNHEIVSRQLYKSCTDYYRSRDDDVVATGATVCARRPSQLRRRQLRVSRTLRG